MSYGYESLSLDLDDTAPVAGAGLAVAGAARGAAVPDGVAPRRGVARLYGCTDPDCPYVTGPQSWCGLEGRPCIVPGCRGRIVAGPPRRARTPRPAALPQRGGRR